MTVRFPGRPDPVLADVDFSIGEGEIVGLRGRSGSGKTSLLHTLAGLLPWARPATVGGSIALDGEEIDELDPGQRANLLGLALDRPTAQLFLATPRHELDAARRRFQGAPLLDEITRRLGIPSILDRRVLDLSSGQRQRVALACALAAAPRPVLLDEPTAHLDDDGVEGLRAALAAVAGAGGCALLSEQAGWRLGDTVTRWMQVDNGIVGACRAPLRPTPPPAPERGRAEPVLTTESLAVGRAGQLLLSGIDLAFHPGEIVLLTGPNASGKSTLALALAGHYPLASGRLLEHGSPVRRPRGVALMLPETDTQLFAATSDDELALAGASQPERARVLRRHRLQHVSRRPPWSLSRGERQRLVHAALDVLRPRLMIIDEPAQGLDPEDLEELAELLRIRARHGRAYLLVSHRSELRTLAHRTLVIVAGGINEASSL